MRGDIVVGIIFLVIVCLLGAVYATDGHAGNSEIRLFDLCSDDIPFGFDFGGDPINHEHSMLRKSLRDQSGESIWLYMYENDYDYVVLTATCLVHTVVHTGGSGTYIDEENFVRLVNEMVAHPALLLVHEPTEISQNMVFLFEVIA